MTTNPTTPTPDAPKMQPNVVVIMTIAQAEVARILLSIAASTKDRAVPAALLADVKGAHDCVAKAITIAREVAAELGR